LGAMRHGYFNNFKGANTVLLSGLYTEIADLNAQVRTFAQSERTEIALHDFATVSSRHPAHLILSKQPTSSAGFHWVCSIVELVTVQAKLSPLILGEPGHQYFDLVQADTQLMVSVGEYDDTWWLHHG